MVGILTCLIFGFVTQMTTAKIGDFISPCSVDDPLLNECVVKQGNTLLPFLIQGVREFGILPLDPLQIPRMEMKEESRGFGGLAFNFTDTTHNGWKTMQIVSAKINPKNYRFEINFFNPGIYTMVGDYQLKGSILVLPIVGVGATNMSFHNLNTTFVFDGKPELRNGNTYMKMNDFKMTFTTSKANYRLDNLFGNKELSDRMNQVLNENNLEVFQQVKAGLEDIFSEIYSQILSRIFKKVPYNQLFKGIK